MSSEGNNDNEPKNDEQVTGPTPVEQPEPAQQEEQSTEPAPTPAEPVPESAAEPAEAPADVAPEPAAESKPAEPEPAAAPAEDTKAPVAEEPVAAAAPAPAQQEPETKPRAVAGTAQESSAPRSRGSSTKENQKAFASKDEGSARELATIDHYEADLISDHEKQTVVQASSRAAAENRTRRSDFLHKVFLYLSLPSVLIVSAMALGMYLHDDVHAVTASRGVAGFCMGCAVLLTIFLIYCHMTAYTNPVEQRYIIRILLMVPIYAIDSFLALIAFEYGSIVGLVRDTYEAYVIYMFYALLMSYLSGEEQCLRGWVDPETNEPKLMRHLFPFGCILPEFRLNARTLKVWKVCLVQYMILNPLLTLITVPLYFSGNYKDGEFSPGNSYVYFAFIRFVSVTFAFTSLVYFFFATKEMLMPFKPLYKFAAIKTVVFLSFWQSVLIAALNHFGVIPSSSSGLWSSDAVATGLTNFIICIEMYLVCLAHRFIFSDDPYIGPTGRSEIKCWVVSHAFSVRDVVQDSKEALLLSKNDVDVNGENVA